MVDCHEWWICYFISQPVTLLSLSNTHVNELVHVGTNFPALRSSSVYMRIYWTTSGIFHAFSIPNIRKYTRNFFSNSRKSLCQIWKSTLEGILAPVVTVSFWWLTKRLKFRILSLILWFDELIDIDMHFNGDITSLDAKLLQLPEPEVAPLTSQAIRDFAEKLFDQWLSLPETSNQVNCCYLHFLFIFLKILVSHLNEMDATSVYKLRT